MKTFPLPHYSLFAILKTIEALQELNNDKLSTIAEPLQEVVKDLMDLVEDVQEELEKLECNKSQKVLANE